VCVNVHIFCYVWVWLLKIRITKFFNYFGFNRNLACFSH